MVGSFLLSLLSFVSCEQVTPVDHRAKFTQFLQDGDLKEVASYALSIIDAGDAAVRMDGALPSVHHYLGVALYNLGHLSDAATAFVSAVKLHPRDLDSWINLGDTLLHQFKVSRRPFPTVHACR